jgi:hypothetical protein
VRRDLKRRGGKHCTPITLTNAAVVTDFVFP